MFCRNCTGRKADTASKHNLCLVCWADLYWTGRCKQASPPNVIPTHPAAEANYRASRPTTTKTAPAVKTMSVPANHSTQTTTPPVNGETNMSKTSTSKPNATVETIAATMLQGVDVPTKAQTLRKAIYKAIKTLPAYKDADFAEQGLIIREGEMLCTSGDEPLSPAEFADFLSDYPTADAFLERDQDTPQSEHTVPAQSAPTVDVAAVLASAAEMIASVQASLATIGYTLADATLVRVPEVISNATSENVEKVASPAVNGHKPRGKAGAKHTTRKAKVAEKDVPAFVTLEAAVIDTPTVGDCVGGLPTVETPAKQELTTLPVVKTTALPIAVKTPAVESAPETPITALIAQVSGLDHKGTMKLGKEVVGRLATHFGLSAKSGKGGFAGLVKEVRAACQASKVEVPVIPPVAPVASKQEDKPIQDKAKITPPVALFVREGRQQRTPTVQEVEAYLAYLKAQQS